jgi:gas vesicle protein
MKSGKVFLGVLAGLAAGAVLGILFAPDKGSKTRKQILKRGEGYSDELKEKYDDFMSSMTEKYETTRQDAEEIFSKGKAKQEGAKKEHSNGAI